MWEYGPGRSTPAFPHLCYSPHCWSGLTVVLLGVVKELLPLLLVLLSTPQLSRLLRLFILFYGLLHGLPLLLEALACIHREGEMVNTSPGIVRSDNLHI